MEKTQHNRHFEISDLALASYLCSSGVTLLKVDRTNPRRVVFVFDSPRAELLAKWQTGTPDTLRV